ncbi:D-tyrosyl-tRNA(Tyr) deacylase [Patescibacteria group bacterium]|nr:D-tyrosyl-tRNA(Tyr) deacylase [Patescibacteria group bacterium]
MRVLLQKVTQAKVSVDSSVVGQIDAGYILFLGIMEGDTQDQAEKLADKVVNVRLFSGEDGKINDRSLLDIGGEALIVSQFTLAGRLEKGNRPDYTLAAGPKEAEKLYEFFIKQLTERGVKKVEGGKFGAYMKVDLTNDGPVTLWIER